MSLDRRGFLKFAAGISAGVMVTPVPWKLIDDVSIWTQNWPWIPKNVDGETTYISTVSKLCPSGTGMKIRMVGNRPVRVLPDDDHPLSKGGISALAVAEAQMLYSPSRVNRPLKRSADGAYVAITWDEALAMLEKGLAAAKGDKLACVSGDDTGAINEVLSGMLASAESDNFFLMPGEAQSAAKAFSIAGGKGQLGYDIENSDYVLAIGANILESWGTVMSNRAAYREARPHDETPAVTFVYAGPVQNNTAAVCDQWLPIKPGTESIFALGLAHQLIKAGTVINAPDFAAFRTLAAKYTPQKVAALTGIAPAKLQGVAKALLQARKPLVVTGSEFSQGGGTAATLAGLAVNRLLQPLNSQGGLMALPIAESVISTAMSREDMLMQDFVAYMSRLYAGKAATPDALLFYEANPAYALPQNGTMTDVMKKIPFKVAFTTFLDETAELCDLVLPVPMGLERLDDVYSPYGCGQTVYSLSRQVTPPPSEVRPTGDMLITLAGKLGYDLGFSSYEEVLQARAEAIGADWDTLMEGEAFVSTDTVSQGTLLLGAAALEKAVPTDKPDFPFAVAPVEKLNVGTAKTAIPPYNNKTVRRWELQKDTMYVAMNGATARKIGVSKHDSVVLSNKSGRLTARVNIYEGITTDTVAVLMGFGHTAFDHFSKGKGENVMQLLTVGFEPGTGVSMWNMSGVNISKA